MTITYQALGYQVLDFFIHLSSFIHLSNDKIDR